MIMEYKVSALKYRPDEFDKVIGQNHVTDTLKNSIKENKIPHIIFYGPSGSGKRTILHEFISNIYKSDKQKINQYVMYVDCAHSKGIRFIRDELKFFAKTNIHNKSNLNHNVCELFKSQINEAAPKIPALPLGSPDCIKWIVSL